MEFTKHQDDFLTIRDKYVDFEVKFVFYDVIHSKLSEVGDDLRKINLIRDWLDIRSGTDEKCRTMLNHVDDLVAYLEMAQGAIKERIAFLEVVTTNILRKTTVHRVKKPTMNKRVE